MCAGCGATRAQSDATRRGEPRLPSSWKRLQGKTWCQACRRRCFVLQTVAVPVSGPADGTWAELRTALHVAFGETTRCANWLVTELYARDRPRQPTEERLPKMQAVYLYPEARALFPALASQTLASLERQVQAKYRAARLDLLWRQAVSLPTYRYPTPLPLPARMWNLVLLGQRWHLSVRLGDRRWSLRLRQGPGMQRQLKLLHQVAAGTIPAGEATLYEIRAHAGDHRGDASPERRLMVKVAIWLARHEATDAPDTLIVRTARDAFLQAQVAGHPRVWTLNADHVRRWIAEAGRRQQRLREDVTHDCRRQPAGAEIARVQRRVADQLHRRLDTWTHQAAAQLVARAQHCRASAIEWDDADRGYVPAYPWHQFVATLTHKAEALGIHVKTRRAGTETAAPSVDADAGA